MSFQLHKSKMFICWKVSFSFLKEFVKFFFCDIAFELRAYTLNHTKVFFWSRLGSQNYLLALALNRDPPDACLLSSWDDRCEAVIPVLC
jgi:hypothetical protein